MTDLFSLVIESPIAAYTQQMFLDDLLTSYQHMETRFSQYLYLCYKGFEFRSLWNVEDKLAHHQRLASSAATGTGRLRGVLELTKALQNIEDIENKGRKCFTKFRYSTDIHKWSFNSTKDGVV